MRIRHWGKTAKLPGKTSKAKLPQSGKTAWHPATYPSQKKRGVSGHACRGPIAKGKTFPPPGSHTKIAFGEREESEQIKVKSLVLGKSANKQAPEKPKQKTGRKLQKRGVQIIVKKTVEKATSRRVTKKHTPKHTGHNRLGVKKHYLRKKLTRRREV